VKVFTKPAGITLKRRVVSRLYRQAATRGRSEDVISAYQALRPEAQAAFHSRHVRVERTCADHPWHCQIIVMVTRAKATESPTPNLGPRTTKTTPFAFRNRATAIPPAMAPPAPTAI
jgi:hypothetical protein